MKVTSNLTDNTCQLGVNYTLQTCITLLLPRCVNHYLQRKDLPCGLCLQRKYLCVNHVRWSSCCPFHVSLNNKANSAFYLLSSARSRFFLLKYREIGEQNMYSGNHCLLSGRERERENNDENEWPLVLLSFLHCLLLSGKNQTRLIKVRTHLMCSYLLLF